MRANLDEARADVERRANNHTAAAEELQTEVVTVLRRHNGTADGAANQTADGLDSKGGADAGADLADIGDLGDEGGGERDEAARRETEDDDEDDDAGGALDGDPDGEAEDGGDEADDDHDVVAADLVGDGAGDDTAKDAANPNQSYDQGCF